MTEWAEGLIIPALAPIIEANGGKLCIRAIREYILLLVATGGFADEAEIKQTFNDIYSRGLFSLKGVKRK